jgi:uncharacterized protein (TIGR00730 family)
MVIKDKETIERKRGSKFTLGPDIDAKIHELMDQVAEEAGINEEEYKLDKVWMRELCTAVLKLIPDKVELGDLKIFTKAAREMRYAFKVFAKYQGKPKVSMFGSARTPPDSPAANAAREFARLIVKEGYMVITGAASGIMFAGNEGAGRENSFGLNVRLLFEQEPNVIVTEDPKLITFNYFFTRKLFFMKEAAAVVLCPGGFGTQDEGFEALTLMQTGKNPVVPIVMLEEPGGKHWELWWKYIKEEMIEHRMIDMADQDLFLITQSPQEAVKEIIKFYKNYHSMRFIKDDLIIRTKKKVDKQLLKRLNMEFHDIIEGEMEPCESFPEEGNNFPNLHRIKFRFNKTSFSRLRHLINVLNGFPPYRQA